MSKEKTMTEEFKDPVLSNLKQEVILFFMNKHPTIESLKIDPNFRNTMQLLEQIDTVEKFKMIDLSKMCK